MRRRAHMPRKVSFRMVAVSRDFNSKADFPQGYPGRTARASRALEHSRRRRPLGMTSVEIWRLGSPILLLTLVAVLSGCTVGPKYARPSAAAAPAYKELTPENFKDTDGWKQAQPGD